MSKAAIDAEIKWEELSVDEKKKRVDAFRVAHEWIREFAPAFVKAEQLKKLTKASWKLSDTDVISGGFRTLRGLGFELPDSFYQKIAEKNFEDPSANSAMIISTSLTGGASPSSKSLSKSVSAPQFKTPVAGALPTAKGEVPKMLGASPKYKAKRISMRVNLTDEAVSLNQKEVLRNTHVTEHVTKKKRKSDDEYAMPAKF